ncbi:MAG: hypothetical protein IJ507_05570 [Clostridia bacterium]|nr:hypothetical protein [Clostridia bacterium]
MDQTALELLVNHPAEAARLCGSSLLTDQLHGQWIRDMTTGSGDMTLLAHRGSFKTTCLCYAIAVSLCIYPQKNILFLRKTDGDVIEVIRQVRQILQHDAMRILTRRIWDKPLSLVRSDQFSLTTDCYCAPRGAAQLLGQGIRGSLTGKHADIVITDDIVNLQDRLSPAEREYTCGVYRELQNIRIPGGRIINTGTPWHLEDAISLMPSPVRWDCHTTGLLTPGQIEGLRRSMTPSLFAANYELRHMAEDHALFSGDIRWTEDAELLRGGTAHLDAAYGGRDFTALTLGRLEAGRVCLYGRLWSGHVDQHLQEIIGLCRELDCFPIHVETNGDKGYLARELRSLGVPVHAYSERTDKHHKISTHLHKWWPEITFLRGTDEKYLRQITDYHQGASHDDAPDSAACLLRTLDRPSLHL